MITELCYNFCFVCLGFWIFKINFCYLKRRGINIIYILASPFIFRDIQFP